MSINSSNYDQIFENSPQNDESIESENNFAINILSDDFFINKDKMKEKNNCNISLSSKESELSSFTKEDPLLDKEQINEVKYNFFMILNNDCSYKGEYNEIFSISNPSSNEMKFRRLVIQKITTINNEANFGKKDYIFFPLSIKDTYIFDYNIGKIKQFKITISRNNPKIICDRKSLSIEDEKFPDIIKKLIKEKNEKPKERVKLQEKEIPNKEKEKPNKEKENQNKEKEKTNKEEKKLKQKEERNKSKEKNDNRLKLSDINKKEDTITNKINEQNENDKKKEFLIDQTSEDEANQYFTFYINQEANVFYRFSYTHLYTKEIDGLYTNNKEINLKIKGEINLYDSMKNLISGQNYDVDNDLKSFIIYKNFDSSVICKDTPMILEIKKSFVLFDLLTQIKQNVKIINHLKLENGNIELPKLIIGIMCNYDTEGAEKLFNKLEKPYKDNEKITVLEHILGVINENNGTRIQVLIGAIKDGHIGKYPLNIQDYKIEEDKIKTDFRVDLKVLNNMAFKNTFDDTKIKEIYNIYKDKYKSLTQIETYTLTTSEFSLLSKSSEENKQLKERIKEIEEKNKTIEEEKKTIEEKLKNVEKDKKALVEFLSQYYSKEDIQRILQAKKK